MSSLPLPSAEAANEPSAVEAKKSFNTLAAKEWVFAVVGPAGSGTSYVAATLESLAATAFETKDVFVIKASDVIKSSLTNDERVNLAQKKKLEIGTSLQDLGDEMRKADISAVALKLMSRIKATREAEDKKIATPDNPVVALVEHEKPTRVYIIDSLKNPAEAELLRGIYREAFCLIGVVCEETIRTQRLHAAKFRDSSLDDIEKFMKRDESADIKYGQKVADTFHLADYFVDNTPNRYSDAAQKVPNPEWVVTDKLGRLFDILTNKKIVRPDASETGMFHAKGAQLRSACLSRQVGAALTDSKGNLIATGTNEVPMAGGGVYGSNFEDPNDVHHEDDRCFAHRGYCSNTRIQDEIIDKVIASIDQLKDFKDEERKKIAGQLKKTPLGRLIEFSRAVHAEMDALLSAARLGVATAGTKLFVTTFPCHYCARHIVASGVDEVQYIEPYPKSRAFELHDDALQKSSVKWTSPSKFRIILQSGNLESIRQAKPRVLFRAFTGVAPRLYRRAFFKDGALKDDAGTMISHVPVWERGLLRESYLDVEKHLEVQSGPNA
ncbi:deoxycytidylate deaminase [Variovorax sp. SG517]|uniref:anti-phage dCTP deaminase n=1 Tax=Variovorax sp. SG517 TaxID=2587117 RepID=UPI00159E191B|nr:anti-phage dCTP deaminase [Variovorax sp. SG517]NVM89664.1 deoxycytidylate deaminase [Variovorax sp. SG517]